MLQLKEEKAAADGRTVPDPGSQGEIDRLQRLNTSLQKTIIKLVKIINECQPVNVTYCSDCKYSVDRYGDGDCYCRYDDDLRYIGKNWNHYCGYAVRRQE